MKRLLSLATMGAFVALVLVTAAPAKPVKLSDAAREAAKPRSEQSVLGRPEPSETKTKDEGEQAGEQAAVIYDSGGHVHFEDVEYVPVVVYPRPHPLPDDGGGVPGYRTLETLPERREAELRLGLVGGGGALEIPTLGEYGTGGLLVGAGLHPFSVDLRGFYSAPRVNRSLSASFDGLYGWSGDLALRLHVTPPQASWGVNLMGAGRAGWMGWDFRNPVTVWEPDGSRIVESDRVRFHALLAGIGIEPIREPGWRFGITVAAGRQWFRDETGAGFENDLFTDEGIVEVLAEIVVSPRR